MSHYTIKQTQFADVQALVAALGDCGYPAYAVELHEQPQHLYGYQGDKRAQTAHVIVRRQHVGPAANDLGFVRDEQTGCYTALISEYDARKHDALWMQQLTVRYAYHATLQQLALQGFSLASEHDEHGQLTLTLTRG